MAVAFSKQLVGYERTSCRYEESEQAHKLVHSGITYMERQARPPYTEPCIVTIASIVK